MSQEAADPRGAYSGRPGPRAVPEAHDLDLERMILFGFLVHPEKLKTATWLCPDDFYAYANGLIFEALLDLHACGDDISNASLRARLHETGRLAAAGGNDGYLERLTDGVPDAHPSSLKRLRKLSLQRQIRESAARVTAATLEEMPAAVAAFDAVVGEFKRADNDNDNASILLADLAFDLRPLGKRRATGFPTLDRAMRGGIPEGQIVMVNGPPGVGKTGLAVYLCDRWEREGCACLYYAGDQRGEGIVVRFAQLDGYSRDLIESDNACGERARTDFAIASKERALAVYDPHRLTPFGTLDDAAERLDQLANGRPRVIVVDSVQVARCHAAEGADSARARVEAVIGTLLTLARSGITVIALNEVNRSTYRTGNRQLDSSGLSSGRESSSIEYQGDALIVMRPVKGEPDVFDLEVSKNSRFGDSNPDLRLQLDRARHTFEEVPLPTTADDGGNKNSAEAKQAARSKLREAIFAEVRARPLKSRNDIEKAVHGSRQAVLREVKDLESEGRLVKVGDVYRVQVATSETPDE